MKTAEEHLHEHCNIEYNKRTGEQEVYSSLSSVLIAMEEYAAQPTAREWISMNDRPPDNFTEVYCTDGEYVWYAEYTSKNSAYNDSKFILCKGIGICEPFDYYHHKTITHWMPLPKPPTENP